MSDEHAELSGPDFVKGIALTDIADGAMLSGHAHGEAALLARRGSEIFAIGSVCTHYGAPLADGLLVDDTLRCPWHHACFSLRTGQPLRAPALDPVPCWRVEQRDGKAYIRERMEATPPPSTHLAAAPSSVVIVGGGAAGNAAAEMLRREGYAGRITMVSADEALPCDRPSLSKVYLAGTASEESLPLRSTEFYQQHDIRLILGTQVRSIDQANHQIVLESGDRLPYGALLLATGAVPIRLVIPGAGLPHVRYLRTVADARALVASASGARRAVVVGASFIGLEVAASLRARNIAVDVIGLESRPMANILGPDVGQFIQRLHESHGVTFHLGTTATAIEPNQVTLKNGTTLSADLVVIGIGVRPAISLAEAAGLAVDRGIVVNAYLETSTPGIWAAGDIARWPDQLSGAQIRVEHFVVAERQGQTAARNMLGQRARFDAVPFFWTDQYDFSLAYIGHAEHWDNATIEGNLAERDCTIRYRSGDKTAAVAVIQRDRDGLRAELEFERATAASRPT